MTTLVHEELSRTFKLVEQNRKPYQSVIDSNPVTNTDKFNAAFEFVSSFFRTGEGRGWGIDISSEDEARGGYLPGFEKQSKTMQNKVVEDAIILYFISVKLHGLAGKNISEPDLNAMDDFLMSEFYPEAFQYWFAEGGFDTHDQRMLKRVFAQLKQKELQLKRKAKNGTFTPEENAFATHLGYAIAKVEGRMHKLAELERKTEDLYTQTLVCMINGMKFDTVKGPIGTKVNPGEGTEGNDAEGGIVAEGG